MQRWETAAGVGGGRPVIQRVTRARDRSGAKPLLFWLLFVIDAFAGGVAAMQMQYKAVISVNAYSLWFGVFCAALVGLPVLVWRMWQHDVFQLDYQERIEQAEPAEQTPAPVVQPVVTTSDQSLIRFGKFKLTAEQWGKLADALAANDGRVTRDGIAKAGVFHSLTANWREIAAEFERLGWAANGQLTEQGIAWFTPYGYPPTPKA